MAARSLRLVEKPQARTPPSTAAAATRDTLPSCRVQHSGKMAVHVLLYQERQWRFDNTSGADHDTDAKLQICACPNVSRYT